MTHALTTPTSDLDKQINALRGYLASTPMLADPASVTFRCPNEIAVQPSVVDFRDPVEIVAALLLWTRNLDLVTAEWTRTDYNDVHVEISGRLPGGVRMKVYKGFRHDACPDLVALDMGESDSVSLDELHHIAGELRARRRKAVAA